MQFTSEQVFVKGNFIQIVTKKQNKNDTHNMSYTQKCEYVIKNFFK